MQDIKYIIKYPLLNTMMGTSWCGNCFLHSGVNPLVSFDETMDRFKYCAILKKHMLPLAKEEMGRNWEFQQDNDRKHTSVHTFRPHFVHTFRFFKRKREKT